MNTKSWAYYQEGNYFKKLHAHQVVKMEKSDPGMWKGREYYSTHKNPEHRLKMHHKKSTKGKCFFAYNSGQERLLEANGGGESLTHILYKEVISELKNTILFLGSKDKRVEIEILKSELEKQITINGNTYFLDVFIKFKSNSLYDLKWGGFLGIEVHHTNKVKRKKLSDLSGSDIPVIEIDVNKKLAYKFPEDEINDEKVISYKLFLKKYLTNYIWTRVLNDPSTKEYLEIENTSLKRKLNETINKYQSLLESKNKEKLASEQLSTKLDNLRETYKKEQDELKDTQSELIRVSNFGVFRFIIYKIFNK